MLSAERKTRILEGIGHDGRVVASELSRRFNVSEDTIRRDLRELAAEGLLHRVYGGALPLPKAPIPLNYALRASQAPAAKTAIAKAAAALFKSGQVIAFDGGTTPLEVAQHLPENLNATIVTHSLPILQLLAQRPGIELIAIGGRVFCESLVTVGPVTVQAYQAINPDLCIMGVAGVDVTAGLTALNHEEAQVKRAMLQNATQVAAVAAADKLATAGPFTVAPIDCLTHLVTDQTAPPELLEAFRAAGLQVLTA
jgi:DeoR/GlpR family transcriptional regulator of sugar metabolism